MEQLTEFLYKLLDTSDFPPRWVCGKWSEFHGWLYISSDLLIWLAYFLIPVILIWFIQKQPNIPFLPVFWLFGLFIIFCGATHFIDALIFWWPAYRLGALLKLTTAIISMFTVFALIRDLPKALNFNSTDNYKYKEQLAESNLHWKKELEERENKIEALMTEISEFKNKS